MAERPLVVISLHVEGFGGSAHDTEAVDRDEWDAMTPAERSRLAEDMAEAHAINHVGWGWHIEDPADLASTEAPK
jgi:hypothetical protein